MKSILLSALMLPLATFAVTPKEEIFADINKSGGVYYAYPTTQAVATPAPKGYEPFYASHYGRHGSRYLISDDDYIRVANALRRAQGDQALTPLGLDVLHRVDSLMIETRGRGGDLTPLGVAQHRGIAERMYANYPSVFQGAPEVSARSTTVIRCILSMDAFCERLKELNPKIKTTRESSNRYMNYLNYHSEESNRFTSGDWRIEHDRFEAERVNPQRLMGLLFEDPEYVRKHVRDKDLYWGLFWIASDAQNVETKIDFYDLFTPEELYDLWETCNYTNYVCDADYAPSGGLVVGNATNLLRNIIESADEAIESGKNGATLRFGHDGNLMPLAAILHLEGCDARVADADSIALNYANFRVSPMAGNVQMIFFRNKKAKKGDNSDVLVKFLLNEEEKTIPLQTSTFPFYRWEDVKAYYRSLYNLK